MTHDLEHDAHDFVDEGIHVPHASGQTLRLQLLGGSGVGKTCFIAGLSLLAEQSAGQSFVFPTDNVSKKTFDTLRETLRGGNWPAKTSIADFIQFAIVRGQKRVDVRLSDFGGEGFLDAMMRGNENEAAEQVQSLVADADLLVMMLDGDAVDRVDAEGNPVAFSSAPLIQSVFETMNKQSDQRVDVAVVLTKSDLCVEHPIRSSKDVQQVVRDRAPDVDRFLRQQGFDVAWIPLSMCGYGHGGGKTLPSYSQLSPEGYEELFQLLFQRQNRPRNRWLKIGLSAVVLCGVLFAAWIGAHRSGVEHERGIIEESQSISQLPAVVDDDNNDALRERYNKDLLDAKADIAQAGNVESVQHVLERYAKIPDLHQRLMAEELKELQRHADRRREMILYEAATNCLQLGTSDCVTLIADYLKTFPAGKHAEELAQKLDDIREARYLQARGNVKAIPVSSAESLRRKLDEMTQFLAGHSDRLTLEEKEAISHARDLAAQFLQSRQYHCTLVRTSGFDTSRDHGVEINVGGQRIALFDDSGDVIEKSWNRDFTVTWQAGTPLQVVIHNYDGRNQPIAFLENSSPTAILLFAGQHAPTRYHVAEKWFVDDFSTKRPDLKIQFRCQELDDEDVAAVKGYLLPGEKW